METWIFLGRILFATVFLASGLGHLTQTGGMTMYATSRGVPTARVVVQVSGAVLVLGALSIILGVYGDLGALMIALALVPITLIMHPFWAVSDLQAQQLELNQFLKNISLMGGALVLFGIFGAVGDQLDYTLTNSVF